MITNPGGGGTVRNEKRSAVWQHCGREQTTASRRRRHRRRRHRQVARRKQ